MQTNNYLIIHFSDSELFDHYTKHNKGTSICLTNLLMIDDIIYGFEYEVTGKSIYSFGVQTCHDEYICSIYDLENKRWINPECEQEVIHCIKNIYFFIS